MFSKLFCLMTILFVVFKSGKPTQRMLSIFGDINFVHYNADLTTAAVLGFVYDDANNGFSVATSCTATDSSGGKLAVDANCKVTAKAAMSNVAAEVSFSEHASGFPATGNNVNVMVGISGTTAIKIVEKSDITPSAAVTTVVSSADADVTSSIFLCNEKNQTTTEKLFTITTPTTASAVSVTYPATVATTSYDSINKCFFQAAQTSGNSVLGAATFILIVTDIAQRPVVFIASTITDYAVINQYTINDSENIGTVIGTIKGTTSCPTNDMLTFPNATTSSPCDGNITTKVTLDGCTTPLLSFEYGSKNYTMLVQHVGSNNAVVQCGSTEASSNSKCLNMSIGLFLVFMLKTLKFFSIY